MQIKSINMTLFQARIALIGLRFEARSGMKMTNKVNTYRMVADALGYPKKARPSKEELIQNLELAIAETERMEQEAQNALQGASNVLENLA